MTRQWKPELRRWRNRREPVVLRCEGEPTSIATISICRDLERPVIAIWPEGIRLTLMGSSK